MTRGEAGVDCESAKRSAGDMPAGRLPTLLPMKLAAREGEPSLSHRRPSSCKSTAHFCLPAGCNACVSAAGGNPERVQARTARMGMRAQCCWGRHQGAASCAYAGAPGCFYRPPVAGNTLAQLVWDCVVLLLWSFAILRGTDCVRSML